VATRFLRSKITAPTLHHESVGRSRLADLMVDSTDPLILVSAPAGYGKTTLLVQALAEREGGVAWVTVDSADNDPLRFWTHVAASILGECAALDEIAQELAAGEAERQAVLDRLLAEIEALVKPVVLVLDDLHEITSAEVLDALSRILSNPPENLQVIASTRIDPALPTGRLRAQSRLTEIRGADLAFTVDEAAKVFGPDADEQALRTIIDRTEGWPTALRLLEVASTTARSGPELLDAAAGANPDLADFLSEEALNVQRPEVQQFLLETASLNDLTPTVCDTVTGRAGSLSILRELATNQVFTVLVEPATSTYRYHQLFREFLRSRAQELPVAEHQGRAQRAADFYAKNDQVSEAIRMALEAGNDDMTIGLILDFYMLYAQSGWIVTVFDWLNAFGRDRLAQQPELSLLLAWALLNLRR
jgi:LuxR family maltose regulon positive regulatory protein